MTERELKRRFPNASDAFIKQNSDPSSPPSCPEPEQIIRDEPLAESQGTQGNSPSRHVSVVSFRRRLLDPDNLAPKYFIDGLKYLHIIPDDSPEHITLSVSQKKVRTKDEQKTVIEIREITPNNE